MTVFSITECWMARLLPAAAAAALSFSAPFFFMLPLSAPSGAKAALALILGAGSALLLVFRIKRDHLYRHAQEAVFLGFSWRAKGSLWNPAGRVELLFEKADGDPEESRLLHGLVVASGPDYEIRASLLSRSGNPAVVCALCIAAAMGEFHWLRPALLPLFSLAVLVFMISKADTFLGRFERKHSSGEKSAVFEPEAGYCQWNFLDLEAKREFRGRIAGMEADISRVLVEEAGLTAGAVVLEVGAGGGFLWKHLPAQLRQGWVQAEKNPYSSLYSRRHGNGDRFLVSDVKELPFKNGSFDAVVGLEVLDSLSPQDLSAFLPEAMRLLKPGGRLVHLKDFSDWPGQKLIEKFNAFSTKVLGAEMVRQALGWTLHFKELSAGDAAALEKAAREENGLDRAYAETLADIYAAGPLSDERRRIPMYVSARVLKKVLLAGGFLVEADCLGPDRAPGVMAYIVARKP